MDDTIYRISDFLFCHIFQCFVFSWSSCVFCSCCSFQKCVFSPRFKCFKSCFQLTTILITFIWFCFNWLKGFHIIANWEKVFAKNWETHNIIKAFFDNNDREISALWFILVHEMDNTSALIFFLHCMVCKYISWEVQGTSWHVVSSPLPNQLLFLMSPKAISHY